MALGVPILKHFRVSEQKKMIIKCQQVEKMIHLSHTMTKGFNDQDG